MTFEPIETEGPIIRDKRRIDPETGKVREPRVDAAPDRSTDEPDGVPTTDSTSDSTTDRTTEMEAALAERTADLQRLQAEYVNYKRRVDRDREVARDQAIASVLTSLLPVLDDIGRAREHDELTGGFKAVAESLQRTVDQLGLQSFGEVGEDFDPRIHEALMHRYAEDADITAPVCDAILQIGYRFGERILRPARVAVVEPPHVPVGVPLDADPADDTDSEAGDEPTDQ